MARKPFKIVNDLDLAGNKLIDVSEIYRGSYQADDADLRLLIYAGSDVPAGLPDGGHLYLNAGVGESTATHGLVRLQVGNATPTTPSTATAYFQIAGTGITILDTKNAEYTIATGTAATKITSTVNTTNNTTGALQVAGGVYVAADLRIGGGDLISDTATFNLLTTTATTVNAFTAATSVLIGLSGTSTVDIQGTTVSNSTTSGALVVRGGVGITGAVFTNSNITLAGDLVVNGGDITSTSTTFNLLNDTVTTINFGSAATVLQIGKVDAATVINLNATLDASSSTVAGVVIDSGVAIAKKLYVGTDLNVTGDIYITGGDIVAVTTTTMNLVNTVATTVNAFGAAAALIMGAATGYTRINNALIELGPTSGTTTLRTTTGSTQIDLFNTVATTVNAFGLATTITLGAISGTITIRNPTVELGYTGTTTTLRTVTGSTTADVFNTVATTVNAFGAATTINIAHTGTPVAGSAKFFNLLTFGATTLGDNIADVITLTGTVTNAGIRIRDADSSHAFILSGATNGIAADTTLNLPTTSTRTLTVGLRADGLVDMKSIMAGVGSTALVPSGGGILYSDANGFQILSGIAAGGKVLVSGADNGAPAWSAGSFSVASDQSFNLALGAITLTNGNSGCFYINHSNRYLKLPARNCNWGYSICQWSWYLYKISGGRGYW